MGLSDDSRVTRKGGDLEPSGADRLDACIARVRRQFGIMLFTSQAVVIAVLSVLIIVFDD